MANLPATKGFANREKKMFGEMVVSIFLLTYLYFRIFMTNPITPRLGV